MSRAAPAAAPAAASAGHAQNMKMGGSADMFKQVLAQVLEERVHRIKSYVEQDTAVSRDELSRFVWGTGRKIFEVIAPSAKEGRDSKRMVAWQDAKGMLKAIIDWDKFTHAQFTEACVQNVLEKKVVEVLDSYRTYVLTGEIKTKWPSPKLLGETDEVVCVDKPCMYTCSYGGGAVGGEAPTLQLGYMGEKASASLLLNGPTPNIQLHEYLALKYNYENAVGTRNFWKTYDPAVGVPCACGYCQLCAFNQSGCCNRLDKETSGVMICAKTALGFGDIRMQFSSEHSLEEGGTEKFYLCLVHGEVKIPEKADERNEHWKHGVHTDGRGRIEVAVAFDKGKWMALPYNDGGGTIHDKDSKSGLKLNAQWALTFYEPVAWFVHGPTKEPYTLCRLQIITGRTHQIRFHMWQIGHSLVGDTTYMAPPSDRGWCPRVYLHSYQTNFREPFTDRWFHATSPLPQDLGEIMENSLGAPRRVAENMNISSRRVHPTLTGILTQYDPSKALLFSHDAPANKAQVMEKVANQNAMVAMGMVPAKVIAAQKKGKGKGRGPLAMVPPATSLPMIAPAGNAATSLAAGAAVGTAAAVVPPKQNTQDNNNGNGSSWSGQDWQNDSAKDASWQSHNDWQQSGSSWSASASSTSASKNGGGVMGANMKLGDWSCPSCGDHQFAKNAACRKCGAAKPEGAGEEGLGRGGIMGANMKPGDWSCPSCGDHQFAKNAVCRKCGAAKPEGAGEEGLGRGAEKAVAKGDDDAWGSWKKEPEKKAAEDDDDDDWGGWSAKKEEPQKPQQQPQQQPQPQQPPIRTNTEQPPGQPEAKRPKVEPAQAPVQAPKPPAGKLAPLLPVQPVQQWKRMESRSTPGVYYYWNQTTGQTQPDPPAPWEKRESRSQPGVYYFWNPSTGKTSPEKPEC